MKNQTEENAAPFTAPEIAETFHLKTQGWTTSKGKPITAEQREDLIQNYLKKERDGEYLTKLGEKGLIRTGAVAKACITMIVNGRPFILIRPPSATHLRNWKLPGGKQSAQDRIDPSSDLYLALSRSVGGRFAENWDVIVPLLMTTLRELSEELPFPAHINLGSGNAVAFVNEEPKLLPTDQLPLQQRFVRINPQGVKWYENLNEEPEGKERYPGIKRDSTLMFVHAELVDLHASTSVCEPIVLNDDSGTCRWIPLTPSTVHWLSKAPLNILPERMLSDMLSLPSGPITNLDAYHMNTLIESYLGPSDDGATFVRLDKILKKKIGELPPKDREDLAQGTGKKSFELVGSEDDTKKKKFGPLNLAKGHRLVDNPNDGFAVVHQSAFRTGDVLETRHPMHMRADQFLMSRSAGKWWKNGLLPHNIRYQQVKRTTRRVLLHEYAALYTAARNNDLDNKFRREHALTTHPNGVEELARRISPPFSQAHQQETASKVLFELPVLNSGMVETRPIRRFTDISLEMLDRYIDAWSMLTTKNGEPVAQEVVDFARTKKSTMSWANLMMRIEVARSIMNTTSCERCAVKPGEPCKTENMTPMVVEPRTYNDEVMPKHNTTDKQHTTFALMDHLLRDFIGLMGDAFVLPPRNIWKHDAELGIVSGQIERFEMDDISQEFRAKKGRPVRPVLPFSCTERFDDGCQPSLSWEEMLVGHLSPLERVEKTGRKSKGGDVRLYLSGKESEPPFLMQNLVAGVLKREYALLKSLRYKRLSLPDGRPRWNERLLWEFITPASKGSITTLPLDAPIEAWPSDERRIPVLNFIGAEHEMEEGKRFNREENQTAARPSHRLAPSTEDWLWTREATDRPLEGLLPIVSPDVSMGELLDIAAMNGIGVAVAIDAWSAEGLPETSEMFGPADTDWYINGGLFHKNEPRTYRTYGSFLGALNSNKQLNIEVDRVKHERRLFGVLLLDELLNMQWSQ